jgi:hypothetical protein
MVKVNLKSIFVFLLGLFLVVSSVYAEINLGTGKGQLTVKAAGKSTTLNQSAPEATVADIKGGSLAIKYDAAEDVANLASTGNTTVTYSIAKLFLDNGESAEVGATGPYGSFYIANTSTENSIVVVFPDGAKIVMPANAEVSLTELADGNFHLKVLEGTIEYIDPKGNSRMLNSNSAPVLVQGFGTVPGWRSTEPTRNPATP